MRNSLFIIFALFAINPLFGTGDNNNNNNNNNDKHTNIKKSTMIVGDVFAAFNPDTQQFGSIRRNFIQIHPGGSIIMYQSLITDFTLDGNGGIESVAMGIWEDDGKDKIRAVLFESFALLEGNNDFGPWTESDRVTLQIDLSGKTKIDLGAGLVACKNSPNPFGSRVTVYNNDYAAYTSDNVIANSLDLLDPNAAPDAGASIRNRAFCGTIAQIKNAYFNVLP